MYVGQGPMFIIKSDNRVVTFGSASWKDVALENVREFIEIEKEIRLDYPSFDCFSNNLNRTLENESREESLAYIRKELSNQAL
ncbi:mak16 [Corchorus olitorius]|uniref:Mak16 n=1 Tax=Corchorus olitorius TaxID=93759 RepID=A0A1R3L2X0_9ROSI|nr:mak16 [Corchorus olitorius]